MPLRFIGSKQSAVFWAVVVIQRGRELPHALPRYRAAIHQTALGSLTPAEVLALQRALRALGS